ncbi:MAG: YicC/YloC family endoribonuclease, partial [Gemmatimonadales bacterium]
MLAAAKHLKKQLKLKGDVDLAFVARQPDVLTAPANGGPASVAWSDVQPIVEQAARDVLAMRQREGAALVRELDARLDALEGGAL